MSSKKKMIIAISAFAMVVLAAVVAVVAVLAAQQVTVKNSIKISYTVTDVVADIEVYAVKVENGESITWGTAKKASFDINGYNSTNSSGATGTAGEEEANVTFNEFKLSKNECVVLKFVFTNQSAKAFTASLKDIDTSNKNINIYYTSTETGLSSITSGDKSDVSVGANAGTSSTYYVRIAIADTTKDVSNFEPSFEWTLA